MDYDTLSHNELIRLFQNQQKELEESKEEIKHLKERNKFLSFSYEEAPLACVQMTPDGIVTNVNKSVCDIFNKKIEEIENACLYDFLPEDRADVLRGSICGLTPEHPSFKFYIHHLAEDGVLRAYLWSAIGVFDRNGHLGYITGYCYPDEKQDAIANQLLSLREKIRNDDLNSQRIMSCMLEMVQENNTIDVQSILRLINEHYDSDTCCYLAYNEEISKMCLKEIVSSESSTILLPKGFLVSTIPEFINRYKQGFTRIGYFGEEELLCDMFNYLVTNKIPYTASMSEPIVSNGKLWGVLIIIRQRNENRWTDAELSLAKLFAKATAISLERISIQTELKRHQMLTSLALEKSEIYSWIYDIKTHRFYNNELLLSRLGYSQREQQLFSAEEFYNFIYPDDTIIFRKYFTNSFRKGTEESVQVRVRTTISGQSVYEWFEFLFIPVHDPVSSEIIEVIGTASCIERHKQSEKKLMDMLEAKNQAEESNRMKTAFVANMSHEIRTPLNAIIGFSEILMEEDLSMVEKQEYMRIVRDNNRLLLQLVNDILDISRIESGEITPVYEEVNLKDLFREFSCMSHIDLSHNLTIKLEDGLVDCQQLIDRRIVSQIINNFLSNALKFTQEGAITLGYKPAEDESGMTYYVRDTGCGIPEKDRALIFQRFVKLDDFVQGTGLGLSICDTLVKKLGGRIGVISEVGVGSEFWFTLPYHTGEKISG